MTRDWGVSKKRSIRGRSKPGAILRQLCRCYLKGTCTRSPRECWHPPECQFYKTESGCKAWDKCLFPHHKVNEQPDRNPKKGYNSHKRRESDDKNAVDIVKIVPQLGCVSQDSDALVSQRGEKYRWNPMEKVFGSIRKVRFTQSTLRQASIREKKGPPLGKIQVKPHHHLSAKDQSRIHPFGKEVLLGLFLGYALYAEGIWKGDILVADSEELEEMDASEIHARRLNAKEVLTPTSGGNLKFQVADGTVKTAGGDRRLRPPLSSGIVLNEERNKEIFLENQTGLLVQHHFKRTQHATVRKPKWFLVHVRKLHIPPSRCTKRQTVHAERRNISDSAEVHRRYQNHSYVTWCIVGKTNWWLLERRWRKRIIRCMDRLHKSHFIERKASWWINMVRGETDEETNDLKTRQCMARYVEAYVWCIETQSKANSGLSRN